MSPLVRVPVGVLGELTWNEYAGYWVKVDADTGDVIERRFTK